jgi:hypothetical protein
MGTHFLWHTFGALAVASLITYLWRTRLIVPTLEVSRLLYPQNEPAGPGQ